MRFGICSPIASIGVHRCDECVDVAIQTEMAIHVKNRSLPTKSVKAIVLVVDGRGGHLRRRFYGLATLIGRRVIEELNGSPVDCEGDRFDAIHLEGEQHLLGAHRPVREHSIRVVLTPGRIEVPAVRDGHSTVEGG